jgi:hypothetical protein
LPAVRRSTLQAAWRARLTVSTSRCRAISTPPAHRPSCRHGDRGRDGFRPHLTAIGDTVNTASRLETLTKEFAVELVVSEELLERAGLSLASHPCHDVETRGRQGRLAVRAVARANDLKISDLTAFRRE